MGINKSKNTPKPIKQYTVATLPDPASLDTGTQVKVADCGGNIATVVNGVWRFEYPFQTTWTDRPAAELVPVGTELQVTDYANQKWISDGIYWRPAQGRVAIRQHWGKASLPLSTLSGITQGIFTIPGGNPQIKAGMIIPHSKVYLEALTRKEGAGGTAGFYGRLATIGASDPDAAFAMATIQNTHLVCNRFYSFAGFGTSKTQFVTPYYAGPGVAAGNSTTDKKASINTDVDMEVTLSIKAAKVTDSFSLFGYNIWLEV